MAIINGTPGNDTLFGTNFDDQIFGFAGFDFLLGGAGNDSLFGGDDFDFFYGGSGNDLIDGGAGNNDGISMYDQGNDALGAIFQGTFVDLSAGTATDGWGGTDTLVSIENVNGSQLDDVIIGSNVGNGLFGNTGNDQLFGLDGGDYLNGGSGNDLLDGGSGVDVIDYRDIFLLRPGFGRAGYTGCGRQFDDRNGDRRLGRHRYAGKHRKCPRYRLR